MDENVVGEAEWHQCPLSSLGCDFTHEMLRDYDDDRLMMIDLENSQLRLKLLTFGL